MARLVALGIDVTAPLVISLQLLFERNSVLAHVEAFDGKWPVNLRTGKSEIRRRRELCLLSDERVSEGNQTVALNDQAFPRLPLLGCRRF